MSIADSICQVRRLQAGAGRFQQGYRTGPQNFDGLRQSGMAYGKLGDHKQALADSNRAIELDPKNAQAYVNRGMAYSRLNYDDQAISNYKSAARLGNKQAQDHLRSKGISWQ